MLYESMGGVVVLLLHKKKPVFWDGAILLASMCKIEGDFVQRIGFFIQIEGAFVQGIRFFMSKEYLTNADGLVVADSIWRYMIPMIDTIPRQFNVEVLNNRHHEKHVLLSKAVISALEKAYNDETCK
ncbi:hypothetical protein AgCh_016685 [Apium graveolens]